MHGNVGRRKISIYLDNPELRKRLKIAAARRDISISAYCEEAIREKLLRDENEGAMAARQAAKRMDEIRERVGPLDVRTWELVEEGRRR